MTLLQKIGGFALLALGSIPAHANLIVNGSFEDPIGTIIDVGDGSTWNVQSNPIVGPPFANGVWFTNVSGIFNPGIEVQTNPTLGFIDAQDGTHYVELDGHPTAGGSYSIGQFFPTVIGTQYEFSFWYSPRTSVAASNGVDVAYGDPFGTPLTDSFDGAAGTVGQWTLIKYFFTASATQSYVALSESFEFEPADTLGALIDNVQVNAVPIPAAAWLLGSALMGLAAASRRRRVV
jgi:hypothetical protein